MNLQAIVKIYIRETRPRVQMELDCFHQEPNLKSAIARAALAENKQGKRYKHQRRLKKTALEEARQKLLSKAQSIRKCKHFDNLFNLIDKEVRRIDGIGELYVYDTSLRIGAKLNLLPQQVYLHAGTRKGARRLLGLKSKYALLEPSIFPPEFHQLKPHEIEDLLCIFKDKFKKAQVHAIETYMDNHSWCS